jgi:hypothetical protein
VPCESQSGWVALRGCTLRRKRLTLIRVLLCCWSSAHWDIRLVSKSRRPKDLRNRALIIKLCLSSRHLRMHRSPSSSHRSRRAQEEGRRRPSLVHVDVCRSRVSHESDIPSRIWEKRGVLTWADGTLRFVGWEPQGSLLRDK